MSDATLLEQFATFREEAAFAAIVRRHGAVVRGECRRILSSEHDVDDAVQATFLVLARRAADVPWRESVGGWLRGVARRLALHARAGASRRSRWERCAASLAGAGPGSVELPERFHPWADPFDEVVRRDLGRVVNQELSRLPEKYRDPVVLCDLEGMTHEEAAARLGVPTGSMSRRLGRARTLLRKRLLGRGLTFAGGLLVAGLLGFQSWRLAREGAPVRPQAPTAHGASGLPVLLASLEQVERPEALREDALKAARASATAAARLDQPDARIDPAAWLGFTGALLSASDHLASVAQDGDAPSLLAAVRRLNESCVHCHLALRQ